MIADPHAVSKKQDYDVIWIPLLSKTWSLHKSITLTDIKLLCKLIQITQEQTPGCAPAAGLKQSDASVEGVFRVMCCTESFALHVCSDFDVFES